MPTVYFKTALYNVFQPFYLPQTSNSTQRINNVYNCITVASNYYVSRNMALLFCFFYPVSIADTRWGDTVDAFATMMCQRCRSSTRRSRLFHPVFKMVRPGLRWSASGLFTLYCALQNYLGQGALTGDVTIPSQFPSSLVMADATRRSFVFTSFVELPCFVKVEPRYLKLSTSSSFYLVSVMEFAACWVRLFTTTLLFSERTSIPCLPYVCANGTVQYIGVMSELLVV